MVNLSKIIESFIASYGRQFYLGEGVSMCILTAKGSLNADFAREQADRLGKYHKGSYVMFYSPATKVNAGDVVEIGGQNYLVEGTETYSLGNTDLYCFALLQKGGSLS